MWSDVDAWEHAYSNERGYWVEDAAASHELWERASAVEESDPRAAFELYREAAEAGSSWAMEVVGWHHETGGVVPINLGCAEDCYRNAIGAGSWPATLRYARLLAGRGDRGECERVLLDGAEAGFAPAFFWLAWYRYRWSRTRATCREIRPLLERGDAAGHPMARKMLGALMLRGKFGMRELPRGWELVVDNAPRPVPRAALEGALPTAAV